MSESGINDDMSAVIQRGAGAFQPMLQQRFHGETDVQHIQAKWATTCQKRLQQRQECGHNAVLQGEMF